MILLLLSSNNRVGPQRHWLNFRAMGCISSPLFPRIVTLNLFDKRHVSNDWQDFFLKPHSSGCGGFRLFKKSLSWVTLSTQPLEFRATRGLQCDVCACGSMSCNEVLHGSCAVLPSHKYILWLGYIRRPTVSGALAIHAVPLHLLNTALLVIICLLAEPAEKTRWPLACMP